MSEEATKTPLVFDALQEPLLQVLAQSTSSDPEAKVDPKESLSWPAFVRIVVYYFRSYAKRRFWACAREIRGVDWRNEKSKRK
jgi:hypothetical protein